MNINIENDLFTNRQVETTSRHSIVPKILKIFSILVGIIVSVLITIDLTGQLFNSLKEDSYTNPEITDKSLRNLDNLHVPIYRTENLTEEIEKNNEIFQRYFDEQKELVVNFYNKVDRRTYKGKWKSESNFSFLSNRLEGEMAMRIEKLNSYTSFEFEKAFIVFRLLDGHYIDRWTLVRSFNKPFMNMTFTNFSINQNFSTFIDFGEIFEKIDYKDSNITTDSSISTYCRSTINLDWSQRSYKNGSQTHSNVSIILGSFTSNCGFNNITFELELEKEDEDFYKVLFYSFFVTVVACSQIFNTIWLTYKISDSQTYANAISLFTILQNIVWNAYGCLCHFFLTVNYDVIFY